MIISLKVLIYQLFFKYRSTLGIISLFFIFFLLRFYHLGFHDFWYDEVGSIGYARCPWFNWNAPLYWILLHFWIKLFGISEFSLRFPSLIFSFLSVILVFLLGRDIFDKKVGIIAGIFMGLSPFHLWYAQEARDYSMVLFFSLLSSWLFYRALSEDKFKLWLFFILVSLAGFYTNYFYIFLFFAQCLYLVFFRRSRLNFKVIICLLIIALGFSFYLPRFLSKFYYIWGGFWIPEPGWKSLIITLENFILGYNGTTLLYLISDILMGLFFIFALVVIYKKKELRRNFVLCLILFFLPVLVTFFFSKVLFSIYLDRGLIIFSPYLYLILALGIVSLIKPIKVISCIILTFLFLVTNCRYFKDELFIPFEHHTGTYIKKPIKPVIKFLKKEKKEEDIIAFTNESVIPSFMFYSQKRLFTFYYFFNPQIPSSSWQRPMRESKYCIPFYKINTLKFKRLWVIACNWARDGKLDENSCSVKDWLDENLILEFSQEFEGLWIFRYVKK